MLKSVMVAILASAMWMLSSFPVKAQSSLTAEQKKQVAGDLKRFFADLNLSESQKDQLRPILAGQRSEIQAVRNDAALSPAEKSTKIASIRAGERSKIANVLSADQMSKWDAAVVKARAEAKKRRSE